MLYWGQPSMMKLLVFTEGTIIMHSGA